MFEFSKNVLCVKNKDFVFYTICWIKLQAIVSIGTTSFKKLGFTGSLAIPTNLQYVFSLNKVLAFFHPSVVCKIKLVFFSNVLFTFKPMTTEITVGGSQNKRLLWLMVLPSCYPYIQV